MLLRELSSSTSTTQTSNNTASCDLQKFSDDTAIVDTVSEEKDLEYREAITICASTSTKLWRRDCLPGGLGQDLDTEAVTKYLGIHLKINCTGPHTARPCTRRAGVAATF
ncbi:hypothetical protein GOODEAATRI_024025 [Goodea atripinnis]|uniref:Uncharacterized protein n=1 Tax=Goodea atripinnis TaxID=208336 RepID=A0ABV0NYK0_9TELE